MAGAIVLVLHTPGSHLPPELMAALMATVSSVTAHCKLEQDALRHKRQTAISLCAKVFYISEDLVCRIGVVG